MRIIQILDPEGDERVAAEDIVLEGSVRDFYNLVDRRSLEMLDILVTEAASQVHRTAAEDKLRGFPFDEARASRK